MVACPLAKGTFATYPLDSISINFLASWELAKELVRVSGVSRPSARNLLEVYEDPSDLLARVDFLTFSFITLLSFRLQSSPRDYPETHLAASY